MRLALLLLVVVLVVLALFTDAWRTAKSVWLIVTIRPYEQVGTAANPKSILVIGDSTGYGTGARRGSESIAGLLGQDFPQYTITNNSVNGRTINGALEAIRTVPPEKLHELILLQIGGNDILQRRDIAVVRSELLQLVREAMARGENVIMMSSGNVGGASTFTGTKTAAEYEQLSRQFRELFLLVTSEAGVTYVDLFAEPADDVFIQSPKQYLAIDGLHPNSAGYAYWYRTFGPAVSQLLIK